MSAGSIASFASVAVAVAALAGCAAGPARVDHAAPTLTSTEATRVTDAAKTPAAYDVFDGNDLVLQIVDEPGPLISTAPPPPTNAQWVTHRFLSATARSPLHEDKLRRILLQSSSTADYVARLQAAGLRVTKTR